MRGIIIALLGTASILQAQSVSPASRPASPPAADLQRAAQAFARPDWSAAREAYQALAGAYPEHALSRFRLGVAQLELGDLREAETNLRRGETLGIPAGQAAYRIAQLYGVRGAADSAIAELRRAADNGLTIPGQALQADRHFALVRADARWPAVLEAFDAVAQPCKHDPHFREFDFWVGDWDVRPTGQPAVGPPARNTVTLDDADCVVAEHWSAPAGSVGQSFNIYDRSYGEWRQTWVDNLGGQHDYRGHLVGRNMVFEGTTPAPNGKLGRVPTRLTFFNLGRDSVRQFSEVSSDTGRTWQVNYDLMYVRRRQSPGPFRP
jgi:tetratricopeptide (TPR) repeat protein